MATLQMMVGTQTQPTIVAADPVVSTQVMPTTETMPLYSVDSSGNLIQMPSPAVDPSSVIGVTQPMAQSIIPSEGAAPVSLENLANNILDMQLPPLSTAQNPILPVDAKQQNMMPYAIAAAILFLLRR